MLSTQSESDSLASSASNKRRELSLYWLHSDTMQKVSCAPISTHQRPFVVASLEEMLHELLFCSFCAPSTRRVLVSHPKNCLHLRTSQPASQSVNLPTSHPVSALAQLSLVACSWLFWFEKIPTLYFSQASLLVCSGLANVAHCALVAALLLRFSFGFSSSFRLIRWCDST